MPGALPSSVPAVTQLTPRERVYRALALQVPDKTPFHAYESPEHALRQLGRRVHELYFEPQLLPHAMIECAKLYANDVIMMRAPLSGPVGSEARTAPNGGVWFRDRRSGDVVARVEPDQKTVLPVQPAPPPVRTAADIDAAMPVTSAAEFEQDEARMTAIRRYRDAFGGERFLLGTGAANTANILHAMLGSERALTVVLEEPDLCRAIMDRRLEQLVEEYAFQQRHGIDGIYMGDAYASCSLYSPAVYRELFFPYHKRAVAAIHALGMKALLHICGRIDGILENMADTGADILESLDAPSSGGDIVLADAKRRVGHRTCLKGNLDAVHVIAPLDAEEIHAHCLRAMQDAGPAGYILSTEQVTRDTPREHVLAMVQARDDFRLSGPDDDAGAAQAACWRGSTGAGAGA